MTSAVVDIVDHSSLAQRRFRAIRGTMLALGTVFAGLTAYLVYVGVAGVPHTSNLPGWTAALFAIVPAAMAYAVLWLQARVARWEAVSLKVGPEGIIVGLRDGTARFHGWDGATFGLEVDVRSSTRNPRPTRRLTVAWREPSKSTPAGSYRFSASAPITRQGQEVLNGVTAAAGFLAKDVQRQWGWVHVDTRLLRPRDQALSQAGFRDQRAG